MDFEKHAFGIGVITGLFLSYLDIQLSHYLQGLLWPECPEMIEEYLPPILAALEKIAEPNSAEVKLVWISGLASFTTIFAVLIALKQSKDAKNQAQRNHDLEDDRVLFDVLKSIFSSAYSQVYDSKTNLPNNNAVSWIITAQDVLKAIRVSNELKTPVFKRAALIEEENLQRKLQSLLSSDPKYKSLRPEFFYGVANWQSVGIMKAKIMSLDTTKLGFEDQWKPEPKIKEDEQWFSFNSIAVVYCFVYQKCFLDSFIAENMTDMTDFQLWREFENSYNFHHIKEWDSVFYTQNISSHGIYKFIKHQYVRLLDIKRYRDEERTNLELETSYSKGKSHLKDNQLFLRFTDKKLEFKAENSIPDGKFYLSVDPSYVCLKSELKSNQPVFTCKAIVLKNIHPYLRLKTIEGSLLIYIKQTGSEYYSLKIGAEVEIAITKTELLNEIGEPVKHKFVAVDV